MPGIGGKTAKFQIMLAPADITAIDDMRFASRIPSRAEAVRQLIERGLRALAEDARNEDADGAGPQKAAPSASMHPAKGGPNVDVT